MPVQFSKLPIATKSTRLTASRRSFLALTLATTSVGLLNGCVLVPVGLTYGGGGDDYDETVMIEPPQPRYEAVIVAPGPGYFWIGGFWNWIGSRHVWVGGQWAQHRHGYQWAPQRWHRDGRGWRSSRGHWRQR